MKAFIFGLSLTMILSMSVAGASATPKVVASVYHDACGYYSATLADLHITYSGPLESGARVFLKYTHVGHTLSYDSAGKLIEIPFGWNYPTEVEMTATGPGVREIDLELGLRSRGSNNFTDKLGFVFHIVLPNGEYWDNGFQSTWGSYEAAFPAGNIQCWDRDPAHKPVPIELPIVIVNKY